jgi:hypothetical protein
MAQRGFVLLSGILILGIFMFVSTIYTLENYHSTSQTQQSHSLQHPAAYSFLNPFSSNSSSSSSTSLHFPIPFFQNDSVWDFNHRFDHLFNQSSFPSIENYFSSNTDSSPSNLTSSSSSFHRPYLTFVQNQTLNLWKNVNDQFKNLKFYQYTNWNVTEASNSSSFESQLVNLFVSKSKLEDSRTNSYLRGEPELDEGEEEPEERARREEKSIPSGTGLFRFEILF